MFIAAMALTMTAGLIAATFVAIRDSEQDELPHNSI